jgi:hypothetical protein
VTAKTYTVSSNDDRGRAINFHLGSGTGCSECSPLGYGQSPFLRLSFPGMRSHRAQQDQFHVSFLDRATALLRSCYSKQLDVR